jgi:hypothetical protein
MYFENGREDEIKIHKIDCVFLEYLFCNKSHHHIILEMTNNYSITPPVPPTFHYLQERNRIYVSDAYEVISRNEWWDPFRTALLSRGVDSNTGFMFNTDPLYRRIMNAVGSTEIGGRHSGASIGFVMREMEIIALYGEPEYRRLRTVPPPIQT